MSSAQACVADVKRPLDQVQRQLLISREAERRTRVVGDCVTCKEFPSNLLGLQRVPRLLVPTVESSLESHAPSCITARQLADTFRLLSCAPRTLRPTWMHAATFAWGVTLRSLPSAVQSKALDSELHRSCEGPTAICVHGFKGLQRTRSGSDHSVDSRVWNKSTQGQEFTVTRVAGRLQPHSARAGVAIIVISWWKPLWVQTGNINHFWRGGSQ